METIITFKAIRDGNVVYKNIPIRHDFKEIPSQVFQGIELSATSVESQVIHYLDEIDKRDMMIEHDFDIILDYFPKRKRVKKNEFKEFIEFCEPYLQPHPELRRPFEAVVSESYDILFGKRKSNETKFKEVFKMISISFKGAIGGANMILKIMKEGNKELRELSRKEIDYGNIKI